MGRPSRPLLTRDGIMEAALALVDEEGAEALSTTRLAARLGVKGPSLYNYVSSRAEIVDGISELIVAEMDLDPTIRPWTAALDSWARTYRATFAAHPNMVPLLVTRPTRSIAAFQSYANTLAVLREAGWPEDRLAPIVQCLEYFLAGAALDFGLPRELSLPAEGLPPGLEPILTAPPNLSDLAFETGLTILIRGFEEILNSLRPQRHN
ncbi:TetR/AcrR family transcriptional regulator C-terminal domain-containing protein [Kitasatospora aureofaciens]|uniref:TetR/AcrR family transcriptional regulator C-terminal domain-containing protein n=1 Tax=Kitasatospora aureofaciens TaxID=1894 RepID=UPI001C446A6B|nr:TetR/AcrR family transcriptional regulator C-terminal domain-containing protein [Kitasatospora aureofaciens]MBV6699429.1 TetR/AcrR family transcriptional regulator C-terminal domain-containing protein [Kitasatospora aureofaciens]